MSNVLELGADGYVSDPSTPPKRGPGRPRGSFNKPKAPADTVSAEDELDIELGKLAKRKAVALTEKEEALARQNWLKYEIDSGNYLPRSAYREASATLLAEVAQALRSIPDMLERKFSLPPEALVMVQTVIDDQLNTLADGLEMFAGSDE